jgi:hypothetical protein
VCLLLCGGCQITLAQFIANNSAGSFEGFDENIELDDSGGDPIQFMQVDHIPNSTPTKGAFCPYQMPLRFLLYPTKDVVSDITITLIIGDSDDDFTIDPGEFEFDSVNGAGQSIYTLDLENFPAVPASGPVPLYEYVVNITVGQNQTPTIFAWTILTDNDEPASTAQIPINLVGFTGVNAIGFGDDISTLAANGDVPALPGSETGATRRIIVEDLHIDVDYTIGPSSNLYFSPEQSSPSRIIVEDGATLRIMAGSVLEACSEMWATVEVEDGGKLILEDDVLVKDAEAGITVRRNGAVDSRGTTFKNCYVGILSEPASAQVFSNYVDLLIGGNTFTSDGLLRELNGTIPTQPRAGIEVANTSGPVTLFGTPASSGLPFIPAAANTFQHLSNGIIVRNRSNISVSASSFLDITTSSEDVSGNGVYVSDGSTVVVSDMDFVDFPVEFKRMPIGVNSQGRNDVTVQGVKMDNVEVGVRAVDARILRISENELEVEEIGVDNTAVFMLSHSIHDNRITVDNPTGNTNIETSGIRISSTANVALFAKIFDNRILLKDAENGLRSISASRTDFYGNYIFSDAESYDTRGVFATGGTLNRYKNNLIVGPTTAPFTESTGFLLEDESRPFIDCNGAYDSEVGFFFVKNNDAARFRNTLITDAAVGLQVGAEDVLGSVTDGIMGPQGTNSRHHANDWAGSYTDFGAKNLASTNIIIQQSQFKVDNVDDPDYLPSKNIPGSTWFINQPNSSASLTTCDTSPPTTPPSFSATTPLNHTVTTFPTLEVLEDEIFYEETFKGTFGLTNFEDGTLWTARMRILERFNDPFSSTPPTNTVNQFMNSIAGTGIEEFYDMRNRIRDFIMPLSKSQQTTQSSYSSNLQVSLDSLHQQTSALLAATDSVQIAQLSAARSTSGQDIFDWESDIYFFDSLALESRIDSSTTLLAAIAALPDTILPQSTEKTIGRLIVEIVLDGIDSLTSSDITTLETIASYCPLEAGDAVYWARSLVSRIDPQARFDDRVDCAVAPPKAKKVSEDELAVDILLYPNPSTDVLTLTTENRKLDLANMEYMVVDRLGRVLPTPIAIRTPEQIVFDLRNFTAGMYYVRITGEDDYVQTLSFVVQK